MNIIDDNFNLKIAKAVSNDDTPLFFESIGRAPLINLNMFNGILCDIAAVKNNTFILDKLRDSGILNMDRNKRSLYFALEGNIDSLVYFNDNVRRITRDDKILLHLTNINKCDRICEVLSTFPHFEVASDIEECFIYTLSINDIKLAKYIYDLGRDIFAENIFSNEFMSNIYKYAIDNLKESTIKFISDLLMTDDYTYNNTYYEADDDFDYAVLDNVTTVELDLVVKKLVANLPNNIIFGTTEPEKYQYFHDACMVGFYYGVLYMLCHDIIDITKDHDIGLLIAGQQGHTRIMKAISLYEKYKMDANTEVNYAQKYQ